MAELEVYFKHRFSELDRNRLRAYDDVIDRYAARVIAGYHLQIEGQERESLRQHRVATVNWLPFAIQYLVH
jgi:hypothetical protein